MAPVVVSLADRPDLDRELGLDRVWPEFLKHGDVTNAYWDRLYEQLPEFQLVLVDDEDGQVLGLGNTIPFEWDGSIPGLPAGVDGVLERGFKGGGAPNTLSALVAIVAPEHQGRGLSAAVIEGMRAVAARQGLRSLVAPVRPTQKELYPLTPLERYAGWRRPDGLPVDRGFASTNDSAARSSASLPTLSSSPARSPSGRNGREWPSRTPATMSSPGLWCPYTSIARRTKDATPSRTCGCGTW